MIRNLVFDMGNVLIKYDPAHFIARMGVERAADRELLLREIFQCQDWVLTDKGEIDEAELFSRVCRRIPDRLHEIAHQLIFHWNEPLEPIPGMAELIRECKAAGLGVYLLSNASVRQAEYWPQIPGSEFFDGRVVSGDVLCLKPEPAIFHHLLDAYGLIAGECLFIDDVAENVEGAKQVGIRGVVFNGDVEELRRVLRELGMNS